MRQKKTGGCSNIPFKSQVFKFTLLLLNTYTLYVLCTFRWILCRVCGQAFGNRNSLWQHELRHSKQGLYSCCMIILQCTLTMWRVKDTSVHCVSSFLDSNQILVDIQRHILTTCTSVPIVTRHICLKKQ